MDYEFKVGDKVATTRSHTIGTVIRITPKRKDVVVDFGGYQNTFDPNGWQKGVDVWYGTMIKPLTPEFEQQIKEEAVVKKCNRIFDEKRKNLTFDQAVRILEVLEDENNG